MGRPKSMEVTKAPRDPQEVIGTPGEDLAGAEAPQGAAVPQEVTAVRAVVARASHLADRVEGLPGTLLADHLGARPAGLRVAVRTGLREDPVETVLTVQGTQAGTLAGPDLVAQEEGARDRLEEVAQVVLEAAAQEVRGAQVAVGLPGAPVETGVAMTLIWMG